VAGNRGGDQWPRRVSREVQHRQDIALERVASFEHAFNIDGLCLTVELASCTVTLATFALAYRHILWNADVERCLHVQCHKFCQMS
jgi:hypothetical protein